MSLKKFLKKLTTNSQTATKLTKRPLLKRPFFFIRLRPAVGGASADFIRWMSPRGSIDSGQVIIEYFILLVLLAAFTMIASSTFFKQTQYMTERFTNEAVNKIAPDIW